MNKFAKLLGYDPVEKQTNLKTEIIAGIVTFLAMAYILTVNPNQVVGSGNVYWTSVFMATAFGAIIGTLLMAMFAKMPLAQASGMGLNSMAGGLIAGTSFFNAQGKGINFTVGQVFMLVLISGILFLLLSLVKIKGKTFRELVFDGMPVAVRSAISVGIGLFIAYIGFQNAGIIVTNGFTQVSLVDFTNWGEQTINNGLWVPATAPEELAPVVDTLGINLGFINIASTAGFAAKSAIVAIVGLFLIAILDKLNVKGSVILGILGATIVGIPLGVTNTAVLSNGESWMFWKNYANFFAGGADESVFGSFTTVFKDGLVPDGVSIFSIIMLIITFCMIDMFDTMGTIVGCCGGNRILSDENDKPYNYGKIMMSDSIATCTGAMLGTSTVTTFVESGTGVSAGGRTGLTSFTTACMFLLATLIVPVFQVIPGAATASALIYVGVLMMKHNIKSVDFSNSVNAVSAFLTIVIMVLSYSITKGIGVGLISYTVMSIVAYLVELIIASVKKTDKPAWNVSIVAIVVSVLFLIYFFVPATLF